jgi:hypothetical protein
MEERGPEPAVVYSNRDCRAVGGFERALTPDYSKRQREEIEIRGAMKVVYKGFEISVEREKSMGGDVLLYYSIFRVKDQYELHSGFTSGTDRVGTFVKYLKGWVDDFLQEKVEASE